LDQGGEKAKNWENATGTQKTNLGGGTPNASKKKRGKEDLGGMDDGDHPPPQLAVAQLGFVGGAKGDGGGGGGLGGRGK